MNSARNVESMVKNIKFRKLSSAILQRKMRRRSPLSIKSSLMRAF